MKKIKLHFALFLLPLCLNSNAFAVNSINVQTFNPSTSDHFIFLEDGFKSEWPKKSKYYFGANYNYVNEPLVALNPDQASKAYNIIDNIQTLDVFFGLQVANNFGLFIGAPVHIVTYSPYVRSTFPTLYRNSNATGFGDIKIMGKIRITDDASPTSIALIPEIHLPTGSTENFVSDASTYVGIRAALERRFDAWSLALNLGFAAANNAIYTDSTYVSGIDYRKRLIAGIGGFFPLNDIWGLNVEFNNINMIPFDKALNPNDAYLGVRYAANDNLVFTGGGSIGKIGGPGGSDTRLIAGIRYNIYDDAKPAQPYNYPVNTAAPQVTPTPYAALPMTPQTAAPVTVIESLPRATMQTKRIEIKRPILFENDQYRLMPDSRQTLDDVASLMLRHKNAYRKVLVDGHTSSAGTDKYNLSLSIARARAVRTYLISKGVPASDLQSRGFGRRKPKVPATQNGAAEINRRVEFIILN